VFLKSQILHTNFPTLKKEN